MADSFDVNALLQNPAFLAGVSILGGDARNLGQNALNGLQMASQLQTADQNRKIRAAQLLKQQQMDSFDPTQFLRGQPTTEPMGPDVAGPPQAMLNGQRMQQTGAINQQTDTNGLLAGALKAGFGMNDVAGLLNAINPKRDLTTVAPGASVMDANGNIIATAPNTVAEAKAPTVRQNIVGNQLVSQQWNPDTKTWDTIGTGPRWQDNATGDKLVEVSDETSPSGTRMVPATQAAGMPGKGLMARQKGSSAGKTLPATQVAKMATIDQGVEALTSLADSFKDNYGGYKSEALGNLDNQLKQKFGDKDGQAAWWQEADRRQTQIRHDLMGSQLTKYEGEQFAKFSVHPGQAPDVIKKNLAKQQELQTTASKKLKEYYGKAGYDMSGFGGEEQAPAAAKTVVKTGVDKATGRKVVQYSDGTVGYGN